MHVIRRSASRFVALASLFALVATANAALATPALRPALSTSSSATGGGDVDEDGVSGQIPLLDQLDGKSGLGYHRGLAVVSTNPLLHRGANFAMAWVGQCAYVTTTSGQQLIGALNTPYLIPTNNPLNGMAVIDVANPAQPQLIDILQSPAMLDPR